MRSRRNIVDTAARSGLDAGRRDDAASLRLRLPEAPADYLEGALDNPSVGPDEVETILRSRNATAAILARIARNKAWMRGRRAKRALVSHPKTPIALARNLLPHLFWRHLADVAADARLSAVLRRDAEKLLRSRLPELTVGERVTLARMASRALIEPLRGDPDRRVLEALLRNPKVNDTDIGRVVSREDAPASFLVWLATESEWGRSAAIRAALVRHPLLPAPIALRVTGLLSARELRDLCHDPLAPRLVRVAAQRRSADRRSLAPADVG